jgi:hypothetical protein
MARIPEKTKVAVLEKILESKDLLFNKNLPRKDVSDGWEEISKFAKKLGYDKKASFLRSTFMYNQKQSAAVSNHH